jgi:hypothetical protein
MTLTLELSSEEQAALARIAEAKGMAPEEFAREVLASELERATRQAEKNQDAIAFLEQLREEAASMSDEEAEQAELEWREAMRDLDAHRESSRKLFPELAENAQAQREAA